MTFSSLLLSLVYPFHTNSVGTRNNALLEYCRVDLKHQSETYVAMIRLITPDDTNKLLALAKATGLFESSQIEELAHMLDQHFSGEKNNQDLWLTDYDNEPIGVAYVAPERMTEGTWNLYLIAIHPDHQKQGRGTTLLRHIERTLTERGERVLLVETSGTDDFDYVRAFYRNRGYEEEARIRDFYTEGVDKIIFRKALKSVAA